MMTSQLLYWYWGNLNLRACSQHSGMSFKCLVSPQVRRVKPEQASCPGVDQGRPNARVIRRFARANGCENQSVGKDGRGGLLLERGQERGGDDGDFVAAEGTEVEHVLALLDPTEHRRSIEAHPAGKLVHVHRLGPDGDHP